MKRRLLFFLLILLVLAPIATIDRDPIHPVRESYLSVDDTFTVAADIDDTNWQDSTNYIDRTSDLVAAYYGVDREYWFRLAIDIEKDSQISIATMYFYATAADESGEAVRLQRSTELNLGSMEADSSKPAVTATNEASGSWPSSTTWFSITCTALIQDLVNEASWSSGYYAGFRLYDYQGESDTNAVEDYQAAGTHHAYLEVTYGPPPQWYSMSPAEFELDLESWNIVGTAIFGIFLGFDEATINMWFIFVGLIMVPSSTLYLVKGGRKEISTDKVFFALVAFFVGIAFFIGGIMP